jgi:diguanylate cyclase (GGDEF)-like protein/PAS domain S-box-containing protein
MTFGAGSPLRAALALRRPHSADDLFRTAFAEAPVAAALVSPDGRFIEVNRGLEWLLGYPTDELIGLTFADLAPPGEEPLTLEELGREQREHCIVRAGREPLWVGISAGVVEDNHGDVRFHIVQIENIADRKRVERKLRRLADHDALTWLLNRRSFLECVHLELERMRETGETGALLLLDLDNFKHVNDTSGHAAGDNVLRTTADVLRRRLRSTDVISRLGGDEFATLLLNVTSTQAYDVANDIAEMLREVSIEASIGVAIVDEHTEDEDELIAAADQAMYAAKLSRRA